MSDQNQAAAPGGFLGTVERVGNKLPDPAVLFIALLFIVWVLSWLLSYVTFDVIDPRSGQTLVIQNLLTGRSFTEFLSVMVTNFSHFHPVGVVLVAMLGIGVAEHTGFINAAIRSLLERHPGDAADADGDSRRYRLPRGRRRGLRPRHSARWRHLLTRRAGIRSPVSLPLSRAYPAASRPTSCRAPSTRSCRA